MAIARTVLVAFMLGHPATGAEVVDLCDVLGSPGQYEHKELVVTAGFRVGYEWQELVCYVCPSKGRIWVEFTRDTRGASKLPKVKAFDQLEKVTFQGLFEGREKAYGHLSGYRFRFIVTEVKAATRVWKLNPKENDAPAETKAAVCDRGPTQ
jgi:hypothetical protein